MGSRLVRFAGEDGKGPSPGERAILRTGVVAETRDRWRDMGKHGHSVRTPHPEGLWIYLPLPNASTIHLLNPN